MQFDWTALETLRETYLDGSAGHADYWSSDALLAGYDATFARRIAWKWHWVLRELDRRGWRPPTGAGVLDFGCGTGVAVREALAHWGPEVAGAGGVALQDRSSRALRFAESAVRREFPDVIVRRPDEARRGLVLVSHVLPELDAAGEARLLDVIRRAESAVIVEPGTSETSRRLVQLRERLRGEFHVVAPCTHRDTCGMLAETNAQHWCHFHATPPSEIFMDGDWMHFGRVMVIDLRALPLSFLVLDRRTPAPLPEGTVRVTGHPRFYKAHVLLPGCDAAGVRERRFSKRTDGPLFRAMEKGRVPTLQHWQLEGDEIVKVEPVQVPETASGS